jgi:NAD(P)-dependent dehydrogenase (short-subunit alcohol dehydrogenase family)
VTHSTCSLCGCAEAAVRLSQLGFLVFATVRDENDLRLLQAQPLPNIHPLHLDVASQDSREAALSAVRSRLSDSGHRLLGLVHNAGYAVSAPLELVPLDEARLEYETNVFGLIHLTQLFLPLLRSAHYPPHTSRIVIVSSSRGTSTIAGGATYSSTKHAVEAVGDGFRMELSAWKIGVVLVEPGSHATPFHPKADATNAQNLDRAKTEAMQRCGQEVLAKYQAMSKRAYSPPPSPAKQPIGVVVDAIVTGLLAKYAPARIKAGLDSAMGGVMGAFPAFMIDKFMGKGYV